MPNTNEKDEWKQLCDYIKRDILNYDDSMFLPEYLLKRLRGMAVGKFMATDKSTQKYSYSAILFAFVLSKAVILNTIKTKHFSSEEDKFSYMLAIVSRELNEVQMRLNAEAIAKQKTINLDNQSNKGAIYKPKSVEADKSLADLW